MAYVPLPILEVKIDDLQLDLDNYRIPTKPSDQEAALAYLFASEDVLEAALLILRDGYFDNEVPIVTGEPSSGYVVLEGNRRVSALKALHNPALAPSHEKELVDLLKRYATEARDLPSEIRVLVAPSREAARPRVARLHTGSPKKRWTRDQQATFYYSLLDDDTTVDDLKREYRDADIVRFIRMAVVRRFLVGSRFSDRSLRAYVTGDGLKMSSFEYAYRRKSIAEAVGIAFEADGQLRPARTPPDKIGKKLSGERLEALEHLVEGFRAGQFNTRSAAFKEGTDEYEALLTRLSGVRGENLQQETDGSGPSATSPPISGADDDQADGDADRPEPTREESKPAGRGPNHPRTKKTLDMAGINYPGAPVHLQHRYFELRTISVWDHPIATVLLMRSILETTIKWHFEDLGEPVSGKLVDALKAVQSKYGARPPWRSTIDAVRAGTAQQPGSATWLNLVAHNLDRTVNDSEVHEAWTRVSPLLRRLLPSQSR